jgi:hypothetical protein
MTGGSSQVGYLEFWFFSEENLKIEDDYRHRWQRQSQRREGEQVEAAPQGDDSGFFLFLFKINILSLTQVLFLT